MYVSHTVAWFIITEKAAYNVILAKEKMSYKSNISISVRKETGLLNKRTNTYKTEITNKGIILEGVSLCEKISLYDVSGVLLYETVVHGSSSATIPINNKGIYVIKTSKGYSNKVIYHCFFSKIIEVFN